MLQFEKAAKALSPAQDDTYPAMSLAWYLLGVLVITSVLSFVDRQILILLVQPIRHDLGISDTQISLLQGFAFTILYSILGLPLGRYADRHNRRNLIVCGVAIWSAMTMLSGFASSYAELFAARIGVGIGEATLAPAAFSMICDAFRPQRRGTALGIYSSATYLGAGVSVVLGGAVLAVIHNSAEVVLPLVGAVRSWQAAFICVGAPGFAVALIILTLREPARKTDPITLTGHTLAESLVYLKLYRMAFSLQLTGYALTSLVAYGIGSWVPTLFIRNFHWEPSKAGISYGLMLAVMGTSGGVLGAIIGDRWLAAGRRDARVQLSIVAAVLWIPVILIATQSSDPWFALVFFGISSFISSLVNGLGPTTLQDIVPDWLRGQITALFFFVINLFGLGVGPIAVALVTDHVFHSDQALPYSIPLVTIPAICIGTLLLLLARRHYRDIVTSLLPQTLSERSQLPEQEKPVYFSAEAQVNS